MEPESELGLHFDTLYDENEDQSGELSDAATGEPYRNDFFPETEDLTITDRPFGEAPKIPGLIPLLNDLIEEGLVDIEILDEDIQEELDYEVFLEFEKWEAEKH